MIVEDPYPPMPAIAAAKGTWDAASDEYVIEMCRRAGRELASRYTDRPSSEEHVQDERLEAAAAIELLIERLGRKAGPERPDDIKAQLDAAIHEIELSLWVVEGKLGSGTTYLGCVLTRLRSIKPVMDAVALRYQADCLQLETVAQRFADVFQAVQARDVPLTEAQIKRMVERFLGWRLPENFRPDAGISFEPEFNKEYMTSLGKPPMRHEPRGTNLFDYTQAEAMVRHMIAGLAETNETGEAI